MNSDHPLINLVDGFDEDEDTQRMTQREIAEALAVEGVRCKRGGENPLILAAILRPQWPQQTGEDENVD